MLVKMQRDGHMVDVHPDMVGDYFAAGYREVEVELQDEEQTETKAKTRGRPRKA